MRLLVNIALSVPHTSYLRVICSTHELFARYTLHTLVISRYTLRALDNGVQQSTLHARLSIARVHSTDCAHLCFTVGARPSTKARAKLRCGGIVLLAVASYARYI